MKEKLSRAKDRKYLRSSNEVKADTTTKKGSKKEKTGYQIVRLKNCRQNASLILLSNFEGKMSRVNSKKDLKALKIKTSVLNGRVKEQQGVLTSNNLTYRKSVPTKRQGHVVVLLTTKQLKERNRSELLEYQTYMMTRSGGKKVVMVRIGKDLRDQELYNRLMLEKDSINKEHHNLSHHTSAVIRNPMMKLRALLQRRVEQLKKGEEDNSNKKD